MIWKMVHISQSALKSADVVYRSCLNADSIGQQRRPAAFAVVGGGPKGYYAVERLVYALTQTKQLAEASIHWFNTDRWFGCGGNFRPDQPEFLLVNNSIGTIDAAAISGQRNPLAKWINRHRLAECPSATYVDFASRTLVGHYLSDTVSHFLLRLPAEADVQLVIGRVTDIVRVKGNLRIQLVERGTAQELPVVYQSVMLATGHSYHQHHPGWAAFAQAVPNVDYIPNVYPICSLNRIPAGKPVAIRGLGLTFVDTVLALTEGRGGVFREETGVGMSYRPSGHEPSKIFAFSRSNLPMIARSPLHTAKRYLLRFINTRWAAKLRDQRGAEVDFVTDIIPVLEREMAHGYHRTAWRDFASDDTTIDCQIAALPDDQRFTIDRLLFGTFPLLETAGESYHQRMLRYLKTGLAEAAKGERGSPLMAAVAVWREAVPIIRELYNHGGFSGDAHQIFLHRYYGALNRVAFGPPAANMKKIHCLAEAGYIHFPFSVPSQVRTDHQKEVFVISVGSSKAEARVFIDARIARPDLAAGNAALFTNLLAAGLATPMENGGFQPGCVAIAPSGRLLRGDGKPTNIAVYGTPTEGATLDNDSLSPSCNDLATPWAEAVAASMIHQQKTQLTRV